MWEEGKTWERPLTLRGIRCNSWCLGDCLLATVANTSFNIFFEAPFYYYKSRQSRDSQAESSQVGDSQISLQHLWLENRQEQFFLTNCQEAFSHLKVSLFLLESNFDLLVSSQMSKMSHILKATTSYFYITIVPQILVMALQQRHVYMPPLLLILDSSTYCHLTERPKRIPQTVVSGCVHTALHKFTFLVQSIAKFQHNFHFLSVMFGSFQLTNNGTET